MSSPEVNASSTCIYFLSLLGSIDSGVFSFYSFLGRKPAFTSGHIIAINPFVAHCASGAMNIWSTDYIIFAKEYSFTHNIMVQYWQFNIERFDLPWSSSKNKHISNVEYSNRKFNRPWIKFFYIKFLSLNSKNKPCRQFIQLIKLCASATLR